LLRDALRAGAVVTPVFIKCGLPWERAGLNAVSRVCGYLASPRLRDVVTISVDLRNLLPKHLLVDPIATGIVNTSEQLEVPLRNLILTSMAANAFRHAGSLRIWVGTTGDNSFNDGSRRFFDACQTVLSIDLGHPVAIETPYIEWSKWQVIQSSEPELLSLSWSCVTPNTSLHCGRCIKCRRRGEAFQRAGIIDPTQYETLGD